MELRHPFLGYGDVVSTEHYLASLLASDVIRDGGNAVDAAVVASLSLAITLPHLNGLGGDFFALVGYRDRGEVLFVDGSGPAPSNLNVDLVRSLGHESMPERGPLPITVPGYVDALHLMWRELGSLEWSDLVGRVIRILDRGFPASRSLVRAVRMQEDLLRGDRGSAEAYLGITRLGQRVRFEGLRRVLDVISEDPRDFYEGEIAEEMVNYVRERGGVLEVEDLASYHASMGSPLEVDVWSCTAHEMPPPTQGLTTLHMMMLTEGDWSFDPNSWRRIELMVNASRRAYAIRDSYITDPAHMSVGVEDLLDPHLLERGSEPGSLSEGDTTFFAVADGDGTIVAGIQSLFMPFGSGLTVPGLGITLNNRGSSFSLLEGHANMLEPGKRTLHTLSSLLMRCEDDWYAIGTSGGHYRPQLHWWIAGNIFKYGMSPQEALDYPRAFVDPSRGVLIAETGIDLSGAGSMGLEARRRAFPSRMGVAAIVVVRGDGLRMGCSDVRGDGLAIGTV